MLILCSMFKNGIIFSEVAQQNKNIERKKHFLNSAFISPCRRDKEGAIQVHSVLATVGGKCCLGAVNCNTNWDYKYSRPEEFKATDCSIRQMQSASF